MDLFCIFIIPPVSLHNMEMYQLLDHQTTNHICQIDASSLISASVMAAPCVLALSKLSYPETKETSFKSDQNIQLDCGCVYSHLMFYLFYFSSLTYFLIQKLNNLFQLPSDEQNILEAASGGASASIGIVANIAANLIAFLAILGFINSSLSWFGAMVGYSGITFEVCFTHKDTMLLLQQFLNEFSLRVTFLI